jgi:hypothetical protein
VDGHRDDAHMRQVSTKNSTLGNHEFN